MQDLQFMSQDLTAVPTGGIVARSLGFNSPYYNAGNGKFRKPNRKQVIEELCIFGFGTTQDITVNAIEEGADFIRHVCRVPPFFHWLPRQTYEVFYGDHATAVECFVCPGCRTITYVHETIG